MPRLRPVLLLASAAAAGCLVGTDRPFLAEKDSTPPTVVSTTTPAPDGGATASHSKDVPLTIVFSEQMDPRTLRPGIAVFRGRTEVELVVSAPDPVDDVERGDIPYTVTARAASGALVGNASHVLVLRTLLTDTEGNALPEEISIPFKTLP